METNKGFSPEKVAVRLASICILSLHVVFLAVPDARADSASKAQRLFNRLAGYPLALNDPRRSQMQSLIEQGRVLDAAKIASQDDNFLNLTVRQFAAPMSNRAESPRVPLNDFIAMFIGTTRDNRDARELLSGNYLYIGNSNDPSFRSSCTSPSCSYSPSPMATQAHFTAIDRTNLAKHLLRIQPQRPDISDAAGVLTSYAWAESFFSAGTNRRATAYALQEFLCTSIQEMADTTLSDYRVRRDVDRAPGGDANTYQTECRGCHTGMDGLSGAWAHFDYNPDNRILQSAGIRGKMNQNNSVFPGGHITVDNSWVNLFTRNQNAALQWRGAMTGRGVSEFGAMLANSGAFSKCMAKRAFFRICHREPESSEAALINGLKEKFEASGYKLRALLEETATLPVCLGE